MAGAMLESICYSLEEGVYRFEPGRGWRRSSAGPTPADGRPSVLVFVNAYCKPGCLEVMRGISEVLGDFVGKGVVDVWLTVCTKFRRLCWDEEARRLFYVYKVYGSPTVIVVDGDGVVLGSLKGPVMVGRSLSETLARLRERLAGEG